MLSSTEISALSRDLLSQGITVRLKASGKSMFPLLLQNDVLEVQPVDLDSIKRGDIVVFYRQNSLIAHRVHHINPHTGSTSPHSLTATTIGDSCIREDELITRLNFAGKVTGFVRRERYRTVETTFRKTCSHLILATYPYINHLNYFLYYLYRRTTAVVKRLRFQM